MDYYKFLLLFLTVLSIGTFGHRFQRHLKNETSNEIDDNGKSDFVREKRDALDLTGDGTTSNNFEIKYDDDYEVELLNDEIRFRICNEGGCNSEISVCFDSNNPNEDHKNCPTSQCEFRAGFDTDDSGEVAAKFFRTSSEPLTEDQKCGDVTMRNGEVKFFDAKGSSCAPVKRDGKIVKLSVRGSQYFSNKCSLKVIGAKKWIPPPPTTPPMITTTLKTATTTKSADAGILIWVIIGVGILLALIIIAGIAFCIYRICQKKKAENKKAAEAAAKVPETPGNAVAKTEEVKKATVEEKKVKTATKDAGAVEDDEEKIKTKTKGDDTTLNDTNASKKESDRRTEKSIKTFKKSRKSSRSSIKQ